MDTTINHHIIGPVEQPQKGKEKKPQIPEFYQKLFGNNADTTFFTSSRNIFVVCVPRENGVEHFSQQNKLVCD